jgi:hypothetical protein
MNLLRQQVSMLRSSWSEALVRSNGTGFGSKQSEATNMRIRHPQNVSPATDLPDDLY